MCLVAEILSVDKVLAKRANTDIGEWVRADEPLSSTETALQETIDES